MNIITKFASLISNNNQANSYNHFWNGWNFFTDLVIDDAFNN